MTSNRDLIRRRYEAAYRCECAGECGQGDAHLAADGRCRRVDTAPSGYGGDPPWGFLALARVARWDAILPHQTGRLRIRCDGACVCQYCDMRADGPAEGQRLLWGDQE